MIRILFIAALFFFQSPDPDAPEFPDQPRSCDNYKSTAEDKRCHCARDAQKCSGLPEGPVDVAMDKKCKTYCRMQHCDCRGHGCRS